MIRDSLKPRRRLKNEFYSLVPVLAVVVCAAALSIKPSLALMKAEKSDDVRSDVEYACAFVSLTPGEEFALVAASKSYWRQNSQLPLADEDGLKEIPEVALSPLSSLADVGAMPALRERDYRFVPFPRSEASSGWTPLKTAEAATAVHEPAFSQEEMLELPRKE